MGHLGNPHRHETPAKFRREVLKEIERRAKAGHPLNSGANRGDWLYAAALRFFGSWGVAVEEAGFSYSHVRQASLSPEVVLDRISDLAARGETLSAAGQDGVLRSAAHRHFGSWAAAVSAAGCTLPPRGFWTPERVVEQIKADLDNGLPVTTLAVIGRNQPLYGAARRMFGSWVKALAAVDPDLPKIRWKRR